VHTGTVQAGHYYSFIKERTRGAFSTSPSSLDKEDDLNEKDKEEEKEEEKEETNKQQEERWLRFDDTMVSSWMVNEINE